MTSFKQIQTDLEENELLKVDGNNLNNLSNVPQCTVSDWDISEECEDAASGICQVIFPEAKFFSKDGLNNKRSKESIDGYQNSKQSDIISENKKM